MPIIHFKNGSSIKLPDKVTPDSGRGLNPFKPHPCQKREFAFDRHVRGYQFPEPEKLKNGAEFTFVGCDVTKGVLTKIFTRFTESQMQVVDESTEETTLIDQEWIEVLHDKNPSK